MGKITSKLPVLVRAPRGVNLTNSGREVKLGLKVAIGLLVLGTICWDSQFYLRRSKIKGSFGVPAEFAPEKWSPPKNWNIAASWLRIAFRSWNFAEICTFGTSIFLYDFFFLFVYFTDQKRYFTDQYYQLSAIKRPR